MSSWFTSFPKWSSDVPNYDTQASVVIVVRFPEPPEPFNELQGTIDIRLLIPVRFPAVDDVVKIEPIFPFKFFERCACCEITV
ncbi:hypothetical protein OKW45_003415 [Paraburkholderia sp. WSM4175]|uniref:hypothetical protein n=1 Tax=Paraburkholderia sp. WSM4175 TaxID=2991072 RepID=UPI003D1D9144